jgi:hypothetical protein
VCIRRFYSLMIEWGSARDRAPGAQLGTGLPGMGKSLLEVL